jgi:hypothetical protein
MEIILEARYINRATDRGTFDGAFMSSEIEPRTLAVRGINIQEVNALSDGCSI